MIQRIPEVELAKQAMRDGKRHLFPFYKKQRARSFKAEMEKATAATVTQASTPSKDTLSPSYQNGA